MTDTTNKAHYQGVWATFQEIRIDAKQAAIQKLRALGIIAASRDH